MIAYLTQERNPDNITLPVDCPWTSWFHEDGMPLPENAILVTNEEFDAIMQIYQPLILKEKDRMTMQKRAEVKDQIIGEIGSENKERIRLGIWTVDQLVSLTQDEQFKAVMNDINGLSFELAQAKMMAFNHPLVTQEIKLGVVSKLSQHMYL